MHSASGPSSRLSFQCAPENPKAKFCQSHGCRRHGSAGRKLPEFRFDLVEQPHRLRPTARLVQSLNHPINRKVRAALIHERNGFAELLERQIKVLVVGNTFLIPEIGGFAAVMYIRRPAER